MSGILANKYFAQQMVFKDDGVVPNSRLPVVIYRGVLDFPPSDLTEKWGELTQLVHFRGWTYGLFTTACSLPEYLHYVTAHQCLAVMQGEVKLQFGGPTGMNFSLKSGDAVFLPAGVGRKQIQKSEDLYFLGFSSGNQEWEEFSENGRQRVSRDIADPGARAAALAKIAALPLPVKDPFFDDNRLLYRWKPAS